MAGLLSILVKDYEGFTGKIGRTVAESEAAWPPNRHPGEKAPNVIVMLFDDLGFSHLGCFGSTIDTPNIDRLAEQGLRYTNFHVTPLCSPTRAALLTGRNHHAVGMGAGDRGRVPARGGPARPSSLGPDRRGWSSPTALRCPC